MTDSPFLKLRGAVPGTGIDEGVARHYGHVTSDQRDLQAGRAIVDLSHLGVIRLTGRDRLTWLDSLTSQRLTDLVPGASAETLLLDVQGRVEHGAAVIDDGESTWLISEPDRTSAFADWLNRMRFLLDVQVADASAELFAVGTLGQLDLGAAAPAGSPLIWRDPWANPPASGVTYSDIPIESDAHPGATFTLALHLLDADALQALAGRVAAGQLPVAGTHALEALRIAAWRPRLSADVDSRTIPHELDWLRSGVHLTKGCYRGQETVAKVHNLGRPPRRVVMLDVDGSLGELPKPDALLYEEGDESRRTVGRISSIATHFEEGPIALALVKRGLAEDAALLSELEDGSTVAVKATTIVSREAGRAADIPRMPRLERRGQ